MNRNISVLLLLLLGVPMQLRAASLVSAKYLRIAGQEVVVEIAINAPPPPTLIVIQSLPPQASVIQAQPASKSVNSSKGEVKWLLRGVTAGTLALRLTLDRPVVSSEISGEVRYRTPGSGDMVSIPIARP